MNNPENEFEQLQEKADFLQSKKDEWFKTNEILPDEGLFVLMSDANGNMSTGHREHLISTFYNGGFVFPAWRFLPEKPDWL